MTINEIKEKGLKYAKEFKDTGSFAIEENLSLTPAEWFAVMQLAEIYYNVFTGITTRKDAIEQQKNVFNLIENHSDIFEFEEEQ